MPRLTLEAKEAIIKKSVGRHFIIKVKQYVKSKSYGDLKTVAKLIGTDNTDSSGWRGIRTKDPGVRFFGKSYGVFKVDASWNWGKIARVTYVISKPSP